MVVKGRGLAAGKGVLICENLQDARAAVEDMLSGESFGESGKEVVIEEFLEGEEASLHLICSGESYVAMPMSQDHKKVGEGDTGLNTGGMGAYAPDFFGNPGHAGPVRRGDCDADPGGIKIGGRGFSGHSISD